MTNLDKWHKTHTWRLTLNDGTVYEQTKENAKPKSDRISLDYMAKQAKHIELVCVESGLTVMAALIPTGAVPHYARRTSGPMGNMNCVVHIIGYKLHGKTFARFLNPENGDVGDLIE